MDHSSFEISQRCGSVHNRSLAFAGIAFDGIDLRPGCTGCSTTGEPVPMQASHVCSLIFVVMLILSGCLRKIDKRGSGSTRRQRPSVRYGAKVAELSS